MILRKLIALAMLIVVAVAALADDYRLDANATFQSGTGHIVTPYPKPKDQKVCSSYLENLRYFAKDNVPMSCTRPVAPKLSKTIKKIEWEDIDPERYSDLLAAILVKESFMKAVSGEQVRLRIEKIKRREDIFRRAKLQAKGTFSYGSIPEAFSVVQYGPNRLEDITPKPIWHCEPNRGWLTDSWSSYMKLYMASEDLTRLRAPLHNYTSSDPATGDLFLIDGVPYVDTVVQRGDILLMELRTEFPIGLTPVCVYRFDDDV